MPRVILLRSTGYVHTLHVEHFDVLVEDGFWTNVMWNTVAKEMYEVFKQDMRSARLV